LAPLHVRITAASFERFQANALLYPVKLYLSAMGGQYPFFFFAFLFGGLILQHAGAVLKTWMLGYWAKQYDQHPAGEVDDALSVYC
jgi:hypothetical protein